jgi:alpha-L-rhamnosidase
MKISCKNFLLLIYFLCLNVSAQSNSLAVNRLRTEYLVNPNGIDVVQPRLSWELSSGARGQSQSAYQIMVGSDSAALSRGSADIWDSRKVVSAQTNQIKFGGKKLLSKGRYFWKVKVWDSGESAGEWSEIASWSMGLLNLSDWQAAWIGAAAENIPDEQKYYVNYGFQSDFETIENAANQRVVIDLEQVSEVNQIKLFPVDYKKQPNGYLFPKRFKIEISATPDFKNARVVADESKNDFEQRGLVPYVKTFSPVKGRYLRISVNKLNKTDEGKYAYALAEMEVIDSRSKNVALKKSVSATNPYNLYPYFSSENWLPVKLTDGFYKINSEHKPFTMPIPASPLLRKTFAANKKVKHATLNASALGLYEMHINGKKIGNQVLAPEWTDYHKRVQYQTYDVTPYIQNGANVIGAMLADGWYAGAVFSHPDRGSYGFDRRLIGQLDIVFEDGTTSQIVTDGSWKMIENGPVQSASIFDGENFDAKLLPDDWLKPNFDESKWKPVTVDKSVDITLSAQLNEPIKIIEEIKPVKISKVNENTYIFDLGQNIAGWANLKLNYNPGGLITFRHGEVLDDEGKLYVSNLRGAKQIDVYVTGVGNFVDYEPRFTYHGFRYVEISGLTKKPNLTDVIGKVVASASPLAGSFESSSKDLNKLWENILWTQRGNMHSVPTDCPQRDERAGWMGDAQVFAQTSIYNLDMSAFFTKWIRDIRDSQRPEGRFPDFSPQVGAWNNFYNSPGWGDAGVLIPWRMYENYGDKEILAVQYDAMKKYIRYIVKMNPNLLWKNARGNMYGDWLNGNTIISKDYPKEGGKVPDDIYSTAFFAHSTRTVAKVSKLLGKDQDYRYFDSLATAIRSKFIAEYVSSDGKVQGNTQAGYAIALDFDLVPDNLKKQAAAKMVQTIKDYDYRISTGIQTTIRMMNQLTEFGYQDVAYKLIESRRFPSWIYSIDQGATTIWERWDGYVKDRGFQAVGMNSFNHYAIGAVGEWMYRSVLGINTDSAGYKHFVIKPVLGGSLTWAKGSYDSIAGKISVDWKSGKSDFQLSVQIPANTTATVYLPAGKSISESGQKISNGKDFRVLQTNSEGTALLVQSGSYNFSVAL